MYIFIPIINLEFKDKSETTGLLGAYNSALLAREIVDNYKEDEDETIISRGVIKLNLNTKEERWL